MTNHDTNDPLARDIERIITLRDQGRLTEAEAAQLIAVVRGDAAVAEADDDSEPAGEAGAPPTAASDAPQADASASVPEAPLPPDSPAAAPPARAKASMPRAGDVPGVRWLVTEMLAADLLAESQPGLEAPRLRREVDDARLEPHGDGWRLRYRPELSSWSFFGNHRGRPERIEIDLPAEMGVELDVKAGDVTIRGVPHVRGRMLAGDLVIDGASFVDVDKKAGDFEARIRPAHGKQRLVAKAGDLDVVLMPGSDVRIVADVKVGDLNVMGPDLQGERNAHGIGQHYRGTLGSGAAELELRLSAGSLTLKTER